jgi:hypothetical protein
VSLLAGGRNGLDNQFLERRLGLAALRRFDGGTDLGHTRYAGREVDLIDGAKQAAA